MKRLSCADMGMMECRFVAEGNTEQEVIDKVMEHADKVHADKMSGLTPQAKMDMEKQMMAKMKDV